ncbi:MAG: protein kinase [bacterium]|nr:protein kinase [bacterium]
MTHDHPGPEPLPPSQEQPPETVSFAASPPPADAADTPHARLAQLGPDPDSTRYVVKGEIGRGGMGAILKVFDTDLRRMLAMKVALGKPGSGEGGGEARGEGSEQEIEPETLSRFLEEAQVTSQLDHPGVVPVHELGVDAQGAVYFTMKLVRGHDLRTTFDMVAAGRGGWNQTRALGVLLKICEAMSYAHDKGVVHRDLKPANVMVGEYGEVHVMDWGLARVEGRKDVRDIRLREVESATLGEVRTDRRDQRETAPDSPLVTMDGSVVGTPYYMPPEQARGETVGPRSDVYAVGAMLYHLLTGGMPYHKSGSRMLPRVVLAMVLHGPPQPVRRLAPGVAPELESICVKAMAREPVDRYADMTDLATDLRAYLEGHVVRAHATGALAEMKKWVGRNRVLATTVGMAAFLIVGGSLGASLLLAEKNSELMSATGEAHANAALANEKAVELEARSYETAIAAADGALNANDVHAARRFLEKTVPVRRGWEWRYLAGRADASQQTLYGHTRQVRCVAFDRTGTRIASYGLDGFVHLWDAETGEELRRVPLPVPPWPHRLSFDANLARAAAPVRQASGAGWEVGVWDLASGQLVNTMRVDASAPSVAPRFDPPLIKTSLARSDGSREELVITNQPSVVRVITGRGVDPSWQDLRELSDAYFKTRFVLVLPLSATRESREAWTRALPADVHVLLADAAFLEKVRTVGAEHDESTFVTDFRGRLHRALPGPAPLAALAPVLSGLTRSKVALSPDGRRVAAGADVLYVWDVESGERKLALEGTGVGFVAVEYDPQGRWLGAVDRGQSLWIFDAETGSPRIPPLSDPPVVGTALAFSADGERVASTSTNTAIQVWEAATGRVLYRLVGHAGGVTSLSFRAGGRRLASASDDATLRVWDLGRERSVRTLLGHRRGVYAAYSPDGERIVSGSDDHTIRIWRDPDTGLRLPAQSRTGDFRMFATPDCTRIAVRSMRGTVTFWDLTTDTELAALPLDPVYRWGAMHPGGERFAATSDGGAIALWETATGALTRTLEGHSGPVFELAWDAAGETLASASADGTARLWPVSSGGEPVVLRGHGAPVRSVAFGRAGTRVYTGGDDEAIRVWDARDGSLLRTIPTQGAVWSLCPLADGARLATLTGRSWGDYVLELWDLTQATPSSARKGTFKGWSRAGIVANADGSRFVVSKIISSRVPVYDALTGEKLLALRGELGVNFGVLGFGGPNGDELLVYNDHGHLVSFDAERGRRSQRLLDRRPEAQELLEQLFDEQLFRQSVFERLCADRELDPELRLAAIEAVVEDPRTCIAVVNQLERNLVSTGRTEEEHARDLLVAKRLRELAPGDPSVVRLVGYGQLRTGQPALALATLEHSGSLGSPGHPTACGFAALAHLQLDDLAAARHDLERVRELLESAWNTMYVGGHSVLAEAQDVLDRLGSEAR